MAPVGEVGQGDQQNPARAQDPAQLKGGQVGRHELVEHADQQGGVERLALEQEPGRLGRQHLDRLAAVAEQPRSHGAVVLAHDLAAGAAGHKGLQQATHGRQQLARLEVDERARRRVRHVDRPPHEHGMTNPMG